MRTVILWWGVLLLAPQVFCLRRHERHRRDPSARADPEVLGLSDSELREEQKENKFKPEFERCDDYKPEVEEESQTGKTTAFFHYYTFFSRKDTIMREEVISWNVIFFYEIDRLQNLIASSAIPLNLPWPF